jgi:2',3'-cyclic-nucleotide 2'-phosphodiesterase/3'-nucleotidase
VGGDPPTRLVHPDGRPVDAGDRFVVAVNDHRRAGGGSYPGLTGPPVYARQRQIRQLLIDWAQKRGVIDPADFADGPGWRLLRGGVPVRA